MASTKPVQIEESWHQLLQEEFEQPYFVGIKEFLVDQFNAGKTVYPPGKLIFNAFDSTPVEQVKVVILGQDPYHNPWRGHGFVFFGT